MTPALVGWAVEALVASALLMALVLVLRDPVRRVFGAQAAYALWALPVLRLLLPPLPTAWREAAVAPTVARAREQIVVLISEPVAHAPVARLHSTALVPADWLPSAGTLLLAIWLVGTAMILAVQWVAHARFCRRMLAAPHRLDRIGSIEVIASAAAPGPLAFGVWRRYVAVPRDFAERYEPRERSLALAHELGHHLRGDLLANWIALVVLALHWFNPLAWRAMRAFRADQEMANDARVLAAATPALRHAYACAIVKAAHGRALSPACHLNRVADLKGRLRMLTRSSSRRRVVLGTAAVVALTLAGLGATASGTATAATIRASVDRIAPLPPLPPVSAQDDLPPPPAPPAPLRAPVAPPAPPAPPVPVTPADASAGDATRVIVRDRFGTIRHHDLGAMPAPIDVPVVESMTCPLSADRRSFTFERRDAGRRTVVICTNRIEAAAREAGERAARASIDAEQVRHAAMENALASLRSTRAGMAANRDMADWERQEVLASIDQSMDELQAELGGHAD